MELDPSDFRARIREAKRFVGRSLRCGAARTSSGTVIAAWVGRGYRAPVRGFDHERLDAYQIALDFVVLANEVVKSVPRGRAHLVDQLQRAATSICLNIAEGAGEFAARDKARFYRMAQRSTTESAAVLDILRRMNASSPEQLDAGRDLLLRLVAMLTMLARRHSESSAQESGVPIGPP